LGHVSLDRTKVRANASKHKAKIYERLLAKRSYLGSKETSQYRLSWRPTQTPVMGRTAASSTRVA
jgi:hypothetical protein